MIKNLTINKTLWFLIASLTLIAAGIGVFNHDVYSKVISTDLLPGTVAQDVITIFVGFVLLFLSFMTNDGDLCHSSFVSCDTIPSERFAPKRAPDRLRRGYASALC